MPSTRPNAHDSINSTSRSLITGVRHRDDAAWRRLVELYGPLVHHWCRRSGLDRDAVADVFQEVFQAVALHIGKFRKEKKSDTFRGWLRVITRHKITDHFRRERNEPRGAGGTVAQQVLAQVPDPTGAPADSESATAPSVEEPLGMDSLPGDRDGEGRLFLRALDLVRERVKETTWQAFWRTTVDGRGAGDVAEELSLSPGAVRVAKSRVLQRLREELGEIEDA